MTLNTRRYVSPFQFDLLKKYKLEGSLAKKELTTPLWLTQEQAKELGYNQGESDFELTPAEVEAGNVYGKIAQTPIEQPKAIAPEAGGNLRNLLLGLYPEKISGALAGGTKVDELEDFLSKDVQTQIQANPEQFIQQLASKRMPNETRALLDYLNVPADITDQVVGVQDTEIQVFQTLNRIPELGGIDVEELANLIETKPDEFFKLIREGGITQDKKNLLEQIGFTDEEIRTLLRTPYATGTAIDKGQLAIEAEARERERRVAEGKQGKFGRLFTAGVGDLVANMGGVFRWAGADGIGDKITQAGQFMQVQATPMEKSEFKWQELFDPTSYSFQSTLSGIIRATPTLMTLAIPGIGAYGLAGSIAGKLGLGAFSRAVITGIGGSALSRPLESAMEAAGSYDEARARGLSHEEATKAANSVFKKNLTLVGADIVQLTAAFAPTPFGRAGSIIQRGLVKTAQVGGKLAITGLTEGGEEIYQDMLQRQARGEKWKMDADAQQVFAIGAIMGLGMGGGGDILMRVTDKVSAGFTSQQKAQFDGEVRKNKANRLDDTQSQVQAMDKVVESNPDVAKQVETATKEVNQELIQEQLDKIQKPITPEITEQLKSLGWTDAQITELDQQEIDSIIRNKQKPTLFQPVAIPKAEVAPEAGEKVVSIPKERIPDEARRISSELEADIEITRKKIADIKTPLPTQGADVQFARLALNDAERLLKQNQALINRIERGEQVSQVEIDALNDELASVKDALNFQIKDVAKARTYLTRYVAKNVPLAERGKLLTAISKIQGAQDIESIVRRANEIAELSEKRRLRAEIIKELKRAKPRKVEGIVKGRFGGDIQTELDIMNRSLKMTRDEALAKIQANQQAYESGTMPYEDMVRDNARLNFTGIEGMTVTELADTLDYIKTLKGVGKAIRIAELEKWKEGIDKAKVDITKVVTGGVAVEPGVTKEFTGFKGLLKRIEGGQVALTDFLDILSGTDKSSKSYSSDLNLFVDDRVIKSYNAEQDGLVATGDTVRDNFKRVFNIKKDREANDILRRLGKEKVNLGTFQNTEGKSVKLELTKGQMIDAYNLMQAAENLPTFTEGNKFTQEMQDAISNGLSTQERAWADWQRSFLADYWTGINNIYEPLYGVKLGRNENYWPRNRDIERSDVPEHILVQEDYNHFASVTNGSLKARTQNKIPFKFLDANTKLLNHVTQMEHFKAWANTIRDLRSVFMSRDIKNAIHQFYGREIGNKIDDYISVLARGGIEKAKRVHILDTLRGNVAVSVLGIKPMIAIKQPLAMLAYATEMPYQDFVTGVVGFLKNPLANYKTLYEKSASLRARYRAGQYERDIKVGVEGGVPTNLSGKANWKERVLTLIQLGDQFGTVPGMWAKYQSELKAGSTDAQAILEAEKLTNRTQNTSQLFTLTTIQHGGSWARLLTMFQDQPNKYFRLLNSNFRNMINGRQGVAKSVSNIALLWVVIPVLFQWMSDAFQWRPERQLRAAALGPVNMLLIIGQATQSVVGWATGEKYPYEPSPVLQIADDIQAAISKMRKLIADGQDAFKDVSMDDVIDMVEFFVKAIGMTTGVPTPYLVQLERMARGQEGKQDLRELLFSRWALEEPKPDLNEKSNDARLKLGLLKEPTGKEATDELPEISNTADYFSEQKKNFSKTLPGDITEKKGFDKMAVVVGQAFIAEDKYNSQPNKRLHEIVDDIEKDESINYTVTQYYLDWQTRSKITSLAKLKEFDDTHPRAFLGNLTPDQLALLVEYENTPKGQRKQFLLDHEGLKFQPRHEWLKKNWKENAQLALFGQAKVLTKEAYNEVLRLAKELDIPDSAIPDLNIPKGSIDNYFQYQDMENKNSWEAQLMLSKDPDLLKFLDRQPIDTPIASLELKVKNRANFDKLDAFSDKDSPDYIADEKARAEAIKKFKADNPEFVDDTRRIEAIEKGTEKAPTSDTNIKAHVDYGELIDKEGVGSSSAETMLYRVDNPEYDQWRQDETLWGDSALKPIDRTKIPIWRIDVKYDKEDAEYQALLKRYEGGEELAQTKDYLKRNPEYATARRQREAYQKGLTGGMVKAYTDYYSLAEKGYRRERFLMDNSDFAQVVGLTVPLRVPSEQYDVIDEKYEKEDEEYETILKQYDRAQMAEQKQAIEDYLDKNPKYANDRLRRDAYKLYVPDNLIEHYVLYKELPAGQYQEDWFMMENQDFYREVYLGIMENERLDFRKTPTREVYAKYLQYQDMPKRMREDYRFDNPDLEDWLILTGKVSGRVSEARRRAALTPRERFSEEIYARDREFDKRMAELRAGR